MTSFEYDTPQQCFGRPRASPAEHSPVTDLVATKGGDDSHRVLALIQP